MRLPARLPSGWLVLTTAAVVLSASAPGSSRAEAPQRYTAKTPLAMVSAATLRAAADGAAEGDVLMGGLLAEAFQFDLPPGGAKAAMEAVAKAPAGATNQEARREAAVLAEQLAPDFGSDAAVARNKALGIVTDLAMLGPFRDAGGGFASPLGPEGPGRSFTDLKADYSWGSFQVRWRKAPPRYASAAGLPLAVFMTPRNESCSFVAASLMLERPGPFVVRLAAAGQAALFVDGQLAARSEETHNEATFERLAAQITSETKDHLVVAKVCTGALGDSGRVRLRVTDERGAPVPFTASAELRAPAKDARVKPMPTPLARTLLKTAKDAKAGSDAASVAAIAVRTLAGADDKKSPSAAGFLDALTQDKTLDADRLAFLAWLTPKGANRTGRYGRARERATQDAETRDFVDRQLVGERLSAQLVDWAKLGAKSAGLDTAKDDAAIILMARIDMRLGIDAAKLGALRALVARFPKLEEAPSHALELIASAAAQFDQPLARRARAAQAARGEIDRSTVAALLTVDGNAADAAARRLVGGSLEDADGGAEAARMLIRINRIAAARELLRDLFAWAPNDADVTRAFAEALLAPDDAAPKGAASARERDDDGARRRDVALSLLARARELAPGDARVRAELGLRNPKPAGPQADERHLAASETILKRRGGAPKPGEAPDVRERQLHWLRAVRMMPDKRVSQLIHYAREIVIAPRTQDELYENLPLEGDLFEILRARVHRKDGSLAFPLEEHNEGRRPRVRWPDLVPGDTVEVAIRTWTDGPVGGRGDPPFYFLDYAGSVATNPLLYNEVIVESQPQNPIHVDVVGGAADKREENDENGMHVVRLVWTKPKTVPDEPLSPQLTEIVPVVVASTFRTWADFRAWYSEAIRGFTEPDAEVRRLAAELTKGKTTREAKLKALFEFVADQIRYVNFTSGEFWLPNRPHELLARREGDCDDKAILLITLLRAVGIEAEEVLVQTRETGQPSVLRAKNAAAPLFDHGIAFLPGPGGGTYLDATSPQSRLGPLPAMDARGSALPLRKNGASEIVELPAGSPDEHGSDVDWTLTLTADGAGDLKGQELHSGDSAFFLRSYLGQEGARTSYVENNLLSPWLPNVEVSGKVGFDGALSAGRAKVDYTAHSGAIARREGIELVVPLAPSRTMTSQLAPLVKRTLPVSLPSAMAPSRMRRSVRIVAPDGFAFGDLPSGGKVDGGEFGRAELTVSLDPKNPRAVVAKRTVVLDRSIIPVGQYEAWRGFLRRVDTLMQKGVRLVPSAERGAR